MEIGHLYLPSHRRQLGWNTPLDHSNCNPTSTGMLIDWETLGAYKPTPPEVRAEMPDQDAGTNMFDSIAAAAKWNVKIIRRVTDFDTVLQSLENGRANIIFGDYQEIPDALSGQPSFDGNHSMIFFFYDVEMDEIFGGDPLLSRRRWYPASVIRRYAAGWAGHGKIESGVAEKRFIKAAEGKTFLPIYRWPNKDARVVATLPVTERIRFGIETEGGWYTVWYVDINNRYRRLYVKKTDAQEIEF